VLAVAASAYVESVAVLVVHAACVDAVAAAVAVVALAEEAVLDVEAFVA
jgi:hypothetical protein